MKTLKCDLCDATTQGKTFEEWMKNLKPHYMQVHFDVISDPTKTKADMDKWMVENRVRFEAA